MLSTARRDSRPNSKTYQQHTHIHIIIINAAAAAAFTSWHLIATSLTQLLIQRVTNIH